MPMTSHTAPFSTRVHCAKLIDDMSGCWLFCDAFAFLLISVFESFHLGNLSLISMEFFLLQDSNGFKSRGLEV